MPEPSYIGYERRLRQQLRAFLTNKGPHQAILSALADWENKDWRPLLFGGLLRDVLILGRNNWPRDIDVVISNGSSEELAEALAPYIRRRTRFGGFQLELGRWHFDVWALRKTWAFVHNRQLAPTPENLPKTTFLNVEAVAVSLGKNGEVRDILQSGFFEAVRTQTLDINFEENPYPALAAVRALATAAKLKYSLSPRLASYIVAAERTLGSDALVAAQDSHYGFVRFRRDAIRSLTRHLNHELDGSSETSVHLPETTGRQLTLWA